MEATLVRFDRHANMDVDMLSKIGNIINQVQLLNIEDKFNILNSLYGLYDGYYYKDELSNFQDSIESDHPKIHESLKSVLEVIETYPEGITRI